MSETKTVKTKKKMSRSALVLTIGLIIIAIPCLVFGWILLSAALETGTPITGNRYDGDLNPAITKTDTSQLEAEIIALPGVENCEIVLKSGQYRINVDATDSISESEAESLANKVYDTVNSKLPVSVYFTADSSKKMYDLAISVYNRIDSDDMVYALLTKNSVMSVPNVQIVSKAVDEQLAKELRGEIEVSDDAENGENQAS